MARPAPGRRVRLALAVVCLASVATAVIDAQDARSPKYSRLQRLAQWTDALERHRPGEADAALEVFGDWEAREFAELKITFYSAAAGPRSRHSHVRPPLIGARGAGDPGVLQRGGERSDRGVTWVRRATSSTPPNGC